MEGFRGLFWEAFRVPLGGLGGALGALWDPRGASGEALGAPWDALGPTWGLLGAAWGASGCLFGAFGGAVVRFLAFVGHVSMHLLIFAVFLYIFGAIRV